MAMFKAQEETSFMANIKSNTERRTGGGWKLSGSDDWYQSGKVRDPSLGAFALPRLLLFRMTTDSCLSALRFQRVGP